MPNNLFKVLKFLVACMTLVYMSYFTDPLIASALSESSNGDNPLEIVIEPSLETKGTIQEEMPNKDTDMYDIFGDEQVFPFVAGLGKNSGKN